MVKIIKQLARQQKVVTKITWDLIHVFLKREMNEFQSIGLYKQILA
jgi:hypothetical protein